MNDDDNHDAQSPSFGRRAGIAKAAEQVGRPIGVFYEQHDAGDADAAFQFAILGEIVYG